MFSNSREDNYEIYTMNLDGSEEQRLTQNHLMDIRPAVSPDGSRIAFTSTRDGNYDVYVMDIDGKTLSESRIPMSVKIIPLGILTVSTSFTLLEHGDASISLCPRCHD